MQEKAQGRKKPRRRSGPKPDDIMNLALLLKTFGVVVALIGGLLMLFKWWLGIFAPVGIACFVVGRGLGKFKEWAWYGAVAALVPLYVLSAAVMVILGGMTGLMIAFGAVPVAAAGYVLWVLLSKGGRARYQRLTDSMKFAAENPDSLTARVYGKGKKGKKEKKPAPENRTGGE